MLWRVELPLALPLIFAGIRTAAVYVVATATLAAVAGGGGLGDIIFNQASYRLAGSSARALRLGARVRRRGLLGLTGSFATPARYGGLDRVGSASVHSHERRLSDSKQRGGP